MYQGNHASGIAAGRAVLSEYHGAAEQGRVTVAMISVSYESCVSYGTAFLLGPVIGD